MRKQARGAPLESEDFEEVSEVDEDDSDSDEDDDGSEEENNQVNNKHHKNGHHRFSSKQFQQADGSEYNSDLDQTMQEKYRERETNNKRKSYKGLVTAGGPTSKGASMEDSYNKYGSRHRQRHNKSSIQKQRRRGDLNYSLDIERYDQRHNETNPMNAESDRFGRGRQMSPNSRMMFQSEAQFLDNYGRHTEQVRGRFANQQGSDDSVWDKLSRIFTFGCIETNHNNRK